MFEKYFPDSLEVHDNCQTTTSGVFSSQYHKHLQTTGGLFSKPFRANVSFVNFSFFFYFTQHNVVWKFELFKCSKCFVRILWRPMTIAEPLQLVCSPPKITSNFRPQMVYFQRRFGPMCPSSVLFFFTSPNPMLSRNLSGKNILKVFCGLSGGP